MSKVNVVSAEVTPRLRLQLVASEPIAKDEIIVQSCEEEVQDHRTWRTLQLDESRHLRNEFLNFVDHSCSPNAVLDIDSLALMAIRDIAPSSLSNCRCMNVVQYPLSSAQCICSRVR